MKKLLIILPAIMLACAHQVAYPRRDLLWMKTSTVTVMRLSGYQNHDPRGLGVFHGMDVWEQHQLDPTSRDELVDFLAGVAAREDADEARALRTGAATAGVWGCVSGSRGIRFVAEQRVYDFVVECDRWIQPADANLRGHPSVGPGGMRLVFLPEEALAWKRVFERHFTKGP
jgi:hypothetical protein